MTSATKTQAACLDLATLQGKAERMKVEVRFYGQLAEQGGRTLAVEVAEGCSIGMLRRDLIVRRPMLDDPRIRACVEDRIVDDGTLIEAGQAVEFLPVVSGG